MQTEFILFFGLIRDNMSSYNLPSVTQSLFCDHLSRLFAYIPCPFLDHKHRIYWHNKSRCRCRCKWDATTTRAIFEKQLTALHVGHEFHLFNRYVFILMRKMRTETKTVPSTWYIFKVQGCTHTDFYICALYCHWLTWGTGPTNTYTHTHTHQQKGHCLPNDLYPSHLQPTQSFFQFPSRRIHKVSYHTTAQK